MINGECFCGEIRYEIDGPLIKAMACHCSRCRKAFSDASSAFAELSDPDEFRWIAGEAKLKQYTSKQGWGLGFCSNCGSTLCGLSQGTVRGVTLGTVNGDPAAASAAFLVVQHADQSIQERYLLFFRAAVAENEARAEDLAMLEDRVLMRQGKKQRYGSQLRQNEKGGWEFYPIEDESKVDERRKAVGLEPLAEYAKEFGFEYWPSEAQPAAPRDAAASRRGP